MDFLNFNDTSSKRAINKEHDLDRVISDGLKNRQLSHTEYADYMTQFVLSPKINTQGQKNTRKRKVYKLQSTPDRPKTSSVPGAPRKLRKRREIGQNLNKLSQNLFKNCDSDSTDSEEHYLNCVKDDREPTQLEVDLLTQNFLAFYNNGNTAEQDRINFMQVQSCTDETNYDQEFKTNSTLWSYFFKTFGGSPNYDYYIKLVDDIVFFMYSAFSKVQNQHQLVTIERALFMFLKFRYNDTSINIIKKHILPYFRKIFTREDMQPQGLIEQFQEGVSNARDLLDKYSSVNDSPIFKKLHRLVMYLLTMQIFEKAGLTFDSLGYSKVEAAAIRKKFNKRDDFIFTVLDSFVFICERGVQIFLTGDPNTIFHASSTYSKIYSESCDLKRLSKLLSDPEAHGFTESEFRARLDSVIEKVENIKKHAYRLDSYDKKIVYATYQDMAMLRDDINTRANARKHRKAPFSIQIFGDSGIGKTTITKMICFYFAKLNKLPLGSEFIFTRNPAANFWDGFVSSCHTVILDDIANEDPMLKDPKSLNEVIQIINNAAFCPDQAALEDKGRTPFKAKLVVGTTNVKNLNAYHYFSCPSAVQRRFPYIVTPKVKPQYLNEHGVLDSEKVDTDVAFPPLWTFTVELVRPVPISRGKYNATVETVKQDVEIAEFFLWFKDAIDKFNKNQISVSSSIEKIEKSLLCKFCQLPESLCSCPPQEPEGEDASTIGMYPQSYEEYIVPGLLFLSMIYIVWLKFKSTKIYQNTIRVFNNTKLLFQMCSDGTFVERYMKMSRKIDSFIELSDSIEEWSCDIQQKYLKYSTQDYWNELGQKMSNKIGTPQNVCAMLGVVSSVYCMYKYYSELKPQALTSRDIGKVPVSDIKKERENPWYNDNIELCHTDLTRESSSAKSMEFSKFLERVSENVAFANIVSSKKQVLVRSRLFCLGGHVWVCNNHSVPDLTEGGTLDIKLCKRLGVSLNHKFVIDENDIQRVHEKELCFLMLRDIPPMKRMDKYLLKNIVSGPFKGSYVSRTSDGEAQFVEVSNIKAHLNSELNFPKNSIKATVNLFMGIANTPTNWGDCGSPLVIQTDMGYFIAGIHTLGGGPFNCNAACISLESKFIEKVISKLTPYNVQSGTYDLISSTSAKRELRELDSKSVFRFFKSGTARLYGSFQGFRNKPRSRVEDTPMSTYLLQHGYKKKFTKPEMSSWVPYNIAAQDLLAPVSKIQTSILNVCVESYVSRVIEKLDEEYFQQELYPLDDFSAINGATLTYIDKINRKTSAGNPWKKSKHYFMSPSLPKHGMLDPVSVDDEIMSRVNIILEKYAAGERAHPNFCAHLKDEPVSIHKATIGKTRVFTGAPFDWTIVVRKMLLTFTRVFQNNRFVFEGAPGTIAQSLEWQEIYDYITFHGKHILVAGDYKAFDKKMSSKEILAAFDIMHYFCKISNNYSDLELQVIRCIAEDTAFATTEFNGDLVEFYGSNPSGNPLTVIINSIVNSLRMRYVYFMLEPNNDLSSFNDHVNLMTYGDDNILNVSKKAKWFNHTAIAEAFSDLDIVYTMADKNAESVPFIDVSEANFLKRTWQILPELGCHVAPLCHESIEKMLMVWVRSKSIPEEAQVIAVVGTAIREYFYYGRKIFEEKTILLKDLVNHLKLDCWVEETTFPTFDQLKTSFINSSRHCSDFRVYFPNHVTTKVLPEIDKSNQ